MVVPRFFRATSFVNIKSPSSRELGSNHPHNIRSNHGLDHKLDAIHYGISHVLTMQVLKVQTPRSVIGIQPRVIPVGHLYENQRNALRGDGFIFLRPVTLPLGR